MSKKDINPQRQEKRKEDYTKAEISHQNLGRQKKTDGQLPTVLQSKRSEP